MTDKVTVSIVADTAPFEDALKNLEALSESFGSRLTGALKSAVVSGRELDDILRSLALNLASSALDAGLKPLQSLFSGLFSGLLGGLLPFSKGGVPGSITPFASGGVVNAPTLFDAAGGPGIMGEAGAEAILPLKRGADGRLGVAATGGGTAVNVVFNVSAADPSSFRKSEAQITAMLARAVARGARSL